MSNLEIIKPKGINPQDLIKKFCYIIGNIPTSYKLGITIEEQIIAIGEYLEKEVFPALNNNAEALTELQSLFIQLKNYVTNFIDDLDVQEEVNNKLDEMAESGELAEIITQYVQLQGLLCFNTLNDLKNAENLINGSFVKTFGTNSLNDGIMYFYKIREILNSDIIDNLQLIALTNFPTLVAERISSFLANDKTNPIFYGADPTGTVDSSLAINNCILANKGGTINFSQGTYLVNQTINLPYNQNEKVSINGNGAKLVNTVTLDRLFYFGFDKGLSSANDVGFPCYIKDLFIEGNESETTYCIDIIKGFKDLKIYNCKIYRFLNGVRIGETTGNPADVLMNDCLLYGKGSEFDGTGVIANCTDNNINMCRIYGFRKGFIINGGTVVKECQVLLRWKDQTSANFDPYTRNGIEFNSYYPLTMFAEVNSYLRCIDSYGDSVYKMLDIKTNISCIAIGCTYYNARQDVDNRLFDIHVGDVKFLLDNFTFELGKNTEGVAIYTRETINNNAQIKIKNVLITAIGRLTNPADLILSALDNYIANKNCIANTWYIAGIIGNSAPYNQLASKLYINGYEYFLRMQVDANNQVSEIMQLNRGTGNNSWKVGTVTVNGNIYVCIKTSTATNSSKFYHKISQANNLCFDVSPVKNNNISASTRLLSDYTDLIPTNEFDLFNVLF